MSNGRQIGPYQVLGELGRGAMGIVYRVVDPSGRELALKLIQRQQGDSEILARFAREAQTMAAVTHPHVIRVHELGEAVQGPYIVTEIVSGPELAEVLRSGPLEPEVAAAIARKLADALACLHTAGIIHRDLKPANIILRDPGREPVLLDFGLARDDSEDRLTKTGTLLGTPNYMAPEQADGAVSRQGPWTDVYGLGAILFAMLSGRPPFTGGVYEVLQKVMQDPPSWPSEEREVPFALEAIVRKAMSKETHKRYTNATLFRDELDRYLAGDWSGLGVAAPPISRRKVLAASGVLGLIALIGVGIWATRSPEPEPIPAATTAATPTPTASAKPRPPEGATFKVTSDPAAIEAWLAAWPDHPRGPETSRLWLQAKLHHPAELNRYRGRPENLITSGGRLYGVTLRTRNHCSVREWNTKQREHGKPRSLGLVVGETWARDPKQTLLAIGGQAPPNQRENLFLYPAGAARPLKRRLSEHHVVGLALSPNGSRLALYGPTTDDAGKVLGWVIQVFDAGRVVSKPEGVKPLHTLTLKAQLRGLGVAKDNETVVILRYPPEDDALPVSIVELWNTRTGKRSSSQPTRGEPAYMIPHPDGRRFLVAISSTYQLALVDTRTSPPDLERHRFLGADAKAYKTEAFKGTPAAHNSTLRGAVFSLDGKRLYSVSGHAKPWPTPLEGELRIWDVKSRVELAKATKLDQRFISIDRLPDGRIVTSAVLGTGRKPIGKPTVLLQTWDVRERP